LNGHHRNKKKKLDGKPFQIMNEDAAPIQERPNSRASVSTAQIKLLSFRSAFLRGYSEVGRDIIPRPRRGVISRPYRRSANFEAGYQKLHETKSSVISDILPRPGPVRISTPPIKYHPGMRMFSEISTVKSIV
jgi:hypothetical protein